MHNNGIFLVNCTVISALSRHVCHIQKNLFGNPFLFNLLQIIPKFIQISHPCARSPANLLNKRISWTEPQRYYIAPSAGVGLNSLTNVIFLPKGQKVINVHNNAIFTS